MGRILERLVSLLWTSFAVLLIGGATLVTLVRVALPQLGAQRSVIEAWLSETVGRPVQVGAINANWRGWAPRLSFERLVILDAQRKTELIHFERADIDIALFDSITRRALKPTRLLVSGVAMNLIRDVNGNFSVAGSYMLRAYPIQYGPTVPARFVGQLRGTAATVTVTVNDTVAPNVA